MFGKKLADYIVYMYIYIMALRKSKLPFSFITKNWSLQSICLKQLNLIFRNWVNAN